VPIPTPNIWQLQSKGDIEGLIEALRHPDATVRKGSAAALRALGAWQAVPALDAALTAENDWQAHAAISAALQYLDRDIHVETMIKNKDVRGLGKMLASSKMEDITTACRALGKMGDRRAVESLVTVFRNPLLPSNVRLAAAEALLELESAPAVVTLLGALRRDNWQVRRNAAAVLGQLQAIWATEPLIELLNDQNQAVRRTAAAALRRINTPDAVKAASAFEDAQAKSATQELKSSEGGSGRGTGTLPKPTTGSLSAPAASPKPPTQSSTSKATAPLSPIAAQSPDIKPSAPAQLPPEPIVTPAPASQVPAVTSTSPTPKPVVNTDSVPTEPAMPQPIISAGSSAESLAGTKPLIPVEAPTSTPESAPASPDSVNINSTPVPDQSSAPKGDTGPLSRLDKLRATQEMEAAKSPTSVEPSKVEADNSPSDTKPADSVAVSIEAANGTERTTPIEPVITPPVDTAASTPVEPEKKPDSGSSA
jgi:hypothetical protein